MCQRIIDNFPKHLKRLRNAENRILDRVSEKLRSFKENNNYEASSVNNQNEATEIFGEIMRKEGLTNVTIKKHS